MTKEEKITFEEAFEKLEQILNKMNEGNMPLNEMMKFFEEGNDLIKLCDNHLSSAQKKAETLIKNINGKLDIDDEKQMPKKEAMASSFQKILQEDTKKV